MKSKKRFDAAYFALPYFALHIYVYATKHSANNATSPFGHKNVIKLEHINVRFYIKSASVTQRHYSYV